MSIAKLAVRLAAWEELARRSGSEHERAAAQDRADAISRRLWREKATAPYVWKTFEVTGSGGHGKARYKALIGIVKAYGCILSIYGPGASPRMAWGDYWLRYAGHGDLVEQVAAALPELLEEIEEAAKAAVKVYGAYLKTLPDTDHDPAWRPSMRRKFRREYMEVYGKELALRILIRDGEYVPMQVTSRPYSAVAAAIGDASRADLRGFLPSGSGYIADPHERARFVTIHAPDYIRPVP
ncbi:hypothetical protein [Streptosporangium sp. NPDC001681]|uniref:hypothetical protein n=1 Tax=Streptosporangium sp. NPDC001681 TaxID=3154395 RepID=UPI003321FEFF